MEYKDLLIFYRVARLGNMTRAAEELGYVQSHVTARIRKLEDELGRPLFERTKHGAILTDDGTRWLPQVETLLTQWEHTAQALDAPGTPSGFLRLGSLETTAAVHAAGWLARYHQQFPEVDLSLETGTTDELLQRVAHRDLDAAFVAGAISHPRISHRVVAVENLQVIMSCNTSWSNICQSGNLVMVTSHQGCAYRHQFETWLRSQNIKPTRVMECASIEAILQLVAGGLGVTLLPKTLVEPLSSRIAVQWQPIDDAYGKIPTSIIWSKTRPPSHALQALLEIFERLADLA